MDTKLLASKNSRNSNRRQTKVGKPTSLHVDRVVEDVLTSPVSDSDIFIK